MCRHNSARIAALIALIGLSIVSAAVGEPLRAVLDANCVSVKAGSTEVLEYRYTDVPFKPYISKLATPKGLDLLLDAPPDHLHHHGLMFADAVDGVNFWEETPTAGRQRHIMLRHVTDTDPNAPAVTLAESLDWVDPAGKKLLGELRLIHVTQRTPPGPTVLTWESRLSVPDSKPSVTLTGSHYFGLGMRFVRSMDVNGQFRNADGKPGVIFRGEERLVDSNWCAYTSRAGDEVVTVAMFGHPDNPRHPTTWFTMATPFAYMSATLKLHEEPLVISAGETLSLRYGVVMWDGRTETAEIDELYKSWARSPRIKSK